MNRQEVADFLGVHLRSVDNLIAKKQIPFSRVPSMGGNGRGRVVFVKENILQWLTDNEVKPVEQEV